MEKTNRHLRLRELLQKHSREATIVVMWEFFPSLSKMWFNFLVVKDSADAQEGNRVGAAVHGLAGNAD